MGSAASEMREALAFGDALARVSRGVKGAAAEALREVGVHAGQNFLLDELGRDDGLTPGELARRLGVDVSTVTRTTQRMEAAGLVRREPDAADARLVRVALTAEGRTVAGRLPVLLGDVYERFLAPLSATDRAKLVALLRRLVDSTDSTGSADA